MNRRIFLGCCSLLAAPSSLLGKLCGKEEKIRILPNIRTPRSDLRTVEPIRWFECCGITTEPMTDWFAPAGLDRETSHLRAMVIPGFSMKDLVPGDLFRLREPDGTLVAGGEIFRAVGKPFCIEGIWGIGAESCEEYTSHFVAENGCQPISEGQHIMKSPVLVLTKNEASNGEKEETVR